MNRKITITISERGINRIGALLNANDPNEQLIREFIRIAAMEKIWTQEAEMKAAKLLDQEMTLES
jgi:hypothetical protein